MLQGSSCLVLTSLIMNNVPAHANTVPMNFQLLKPKSRGQRAFKITHSLVTSADKVIILIYTWQVSHNE